MQCTRVVRECVAGVSLPGGPWHCGSVLQELHHPLPRGSEAVHDMSSTAHYLQALWQGIAGVLFFRR